MRTTAVFAVAILATCFDAICMTAQEPTDTWKQSHKLPGDDGVEGLGYQRDVGVAELVLVSFSGHRDAFDPLKDKSVALDFFAWQPGRFRLVVREKIPSQNYWKEAEEDARAGLNHYSKWATDVLRSATPAIGSENIGVVVRLGSTKAE